MQMDQLNHLFIGCSMLIYYKYLSSSYIWENCKVLSELYLDSYYNTYYYYNNNNVIINNINLNHTIILILIYY